MRRRIYLMGALAWILTIPLLPARAEQPLTQRYLDIYLKINTAEGLEKQGDYRGALADFKDCYQKLAKIHEEDPDWESALVVHRMDDCKAKIDELSDKAMAQPTDTPTPTPSAAVVTPPDTTGDQTSTTDDVPALKLKLQQVQQQLQSALADVKDARSEVEAYRAQLQTVKQQLDAMKKQHSDNDKVTKLLNDNKALSDKLAAAQKQIDTFKSPNPKSKLSLVQAQMKNLQDQFDSTQEANKSLQQTITTLQTQLNQAQSDLVAANQKLAAAGTSSPEYQTLKRENELMRDILTREIQEQAHRDEAKRLAQEEFDNLKLKSKVLQEQLDILGSPMTPATTDEERAILASLKTPGADVVPPPSGNTLSAPLNGNPAVADASITPTPTPDSMAAVTPTPASGTDVTINPTPSPVPAPTDNSTNTPPVTIASNNPTPTPDATTSAPTPTADPAPTSALNALSSMPLSPSPTPTPDSTTVPVPTATPAPTSPPSTPTTDSAPTPTPDPSMSTNVTKSVLPPDTTTVETTTIKHGDESKRPDPTRYSIQPRLPDDMRDTAQQAADLFKMQRYDEAAAKYQSIIDKYPESLYAWSNLGVVRFQQGQGHLGDALKALQQAVKLSPTDAFSYSNLGIVYYQLGQYENAIDALNSAKALDPNDAKTRNYLGCAESQKGWQEVAEKEFRKAIELDPGFGDAHFNLALVYATSKPPSLELARREYNRALELGIGKDARLEKILNP